MEPASLIEMNTEPRVTQKRARRRAFYLAVLTFISLISLTSWSEQNGSAQSGALIPSTSDKPNSATLSLQVMKVDVLIDNQHARVRVLQIFDSHVAQALEGKYLFALPPQSSISDFAIWEGDMRITASKPRPAAVPGSPRP